MRIWPSKRRWKHIGIGMALLLATALIANGFMAWRTESRWRGMVAAIRASGEPGSIAELAPKPIPEDQNAAALLAKLGRRLDEFSKESYHFFDKDPLGTDFEKRLDRGEPATAVQIDAIRAMLDRYSDLDAGIATVAACDQYASVANFSAGYTKFIDEIAAKTMARIRTAAWFLRWRMYVLIATGQQEQAARLGREMLQLARLYDHEPALINMLVGAAVRGLAAEALYDALAAGPVSPKTHAELDEELSRHDDPQRMVRTLKTERGFAIDASESTPHPGQPPAWLQRMFGWSMKRYYVGALEGLNAEIASLSKEREGGSKSVRRHMAPTPGKGGILNQLMLPSLQAAYDADARATAVLRALRIFNALRLFAEKNGREATGLAELGLPQDVTIDPFDGKPLKLKKTDKGWMIYTVMWNGVDDGGDFVQLHDYGVAPPSYRVVQEKDVEEAPEEKAAATN